MGGAGKKRGAGGQGQPRGTAKKGITRYATDDTSRLRIAHACDAAVTIECRRKGVKDYRTEASNSENSMPALSPYLLPIVLLIGSNVFMTTAWYWHLRYMQAVSYTHLTLPTIYSV